MVEVPTEEEKQGHAFFIGKVAWQILNYEAFKMNFRKLAKILCVAIVALAFVSTPLYAKPEKDKDNKGKANAPGQSKANTPNQSKAKVKKFAVRSSANLEDSAKFSFAGQFATFLDVEQSELGTKVKECWSSVFTKAVYAYLKSKDLKLSDVKMSVIVQEMVEAERAGVIFTQDLIHKGNKDNITIEAVNGLGEAVVDGTKEPDRVVIGRKGKDYERGGPAEVLSDKEILKLRDLAIEIENLYKTPQDIEWAIKGKEVYILQTRPVTA